MTTTRLLSRDDANPPAVASLDRGVLRIWRGSQYVTLLGGEISALAALLGSTVSTPQPGVLFRHPLYSAESVSSGPTPS